MISKTTREGEGGTRGLIEIISVEMEVEWKRHLRLISHGQLNRVVELTTAQYCITWFYCNIVL